MAHELPQRLAIVYRCHISVGANFESLIASIGKCLEIPIFRLEHIFLVFFAAHWHHHLRTGLQFVGFTMIHYSNTKSGQ